MRVFGRVLVCQERLREEAARREEDWNCDIVVSCQEETSRSIHFNCKVKQSILTCIFQGHIYNLATGIHLHCAFSSKVFFSQRTHKELRREMEEYLRRLAEEEEQVREGCWNHKTTSGCSHDFSCF